MDIRCFVFLSQMLLALSQVFPAKYVLPTSLSAMNGSSATGHCSNVTANDGNGITCTAPTTSVLFDGNIPTLTGLDGDMWASQLLTIQKTKSSRNTIQFDFTSTEDYVRVERVELVMFNCPEWGIAVNTIRFLTAQTTSEPGEAIKVLNIHRLTSCESFVIKCLSMRFTAPVLTMDFHFATNTDRLYVAEVRFFGSSSTCPPVNYTTYTTPGTTSAATGTTNSEEVDHVTTVSSLVPLASSPAPPPSNLGKAECGECPSCLKSYATVSIVTAIITALLTTIVFLLVLTGVYKYAVKKMGRASNLPLGQMNRVYDQVGESTSTLVIDPNDHTYMEVEHESIITVRENGAYDVSTQQTRHEPIITVKENSAYDVSTQQTQI